MLYMMMIISHFVRQLTAVLFINKDKKEKKEEDFISTSKGGLHECGQEDLMP